MGVWLFGHKVIFTGECMELASHTKVLLHPNFAHTKVRKFGPKHPNLSKLLPTCNLYKPTYFPFPPQSDRALNIWSVDSYRLEQKSFAERCSMQIITELKDMKCCVWINTENYRGSVHMVEFEIKVWEKKCKQVSPPYLKDSLLFLSHIRLR